MKTTYKLLEIKHKKPLHDDFDPLIENRIYMHLYAKGNESAVRLLPAEAPGGNPEALHVDGDDKQVVFVAGSKALCGNVA